MLHRIALLALTAPRRVVGIAALVFIASAIFGIPVAGKLSAGGLHDPGSGSAQAAQLLAEKFGQSDQQLLIVVTAPDGATSDQGSQIGIDIVDQLQHSPFVSNVSSAWTTPPQTAAGLVSKDGKSGLIVANLKGDDNTAQKYARDLAAQVAHDRDGVRVRAGGTPMAYAQTNEQSERDLLLMESIAIPLSFTALVWVFGGMLAAALPVAVGFIAIVGSMSILRLISFGTDVSIFALNLSTVLGLALAIDYTLLIISRYRDEVATGATPDQAITRTVITTGRTVAFSATTVALSMAVLVLFPMHFLRSFAYGGVATVAFVGIAAIVVTPAAIVLLGPRLNSLNMTHLLRRLLRRPEPQAKPITRQFWYRSTTLVMRHAVPIALIATAVLMLLGVPFLGVKWGYADDRLLPRALSARQVGDQLRNDFPNDASAAVPIVITNTSGLDQAEIDRYAANLSRVPDVASVIAPSGTFADGTRAGPPTAATGAADGIVYLTVATTAPLYSKASATQLDRLHDVPSPAGRPVQFIGLAQTNRDSIDAITSRLPLVLGLIAIITFTLMFLLTGSVVLPLKTLLLNVLSLTATFGALVWIFQDGHLGGLGTTPVGTLAIHIPVLMFCIAFGLSMDYEVFLVSRIREHWLVSPHTRRGNDESVALGVARTGRVITAAALVMVISFAALTASQVSIMRMLGLGLTVAVAMDATVIRTVLVPAFMHLMGTANWWAPKALAQLHQHIGISESAPDGHQTTQVTQANRRNSPADVIENPDGNR